MGYVCGGEFATTNLDISNTGSGDPTMQGIEETGVDDEITLDSDPNPPLVIGEGAHVNFTVRCEPTSIGSKSATFRITSNDSDEREIDLVYSCTVAEADIDTLIADSGDFGDVCLDDFRDLDVTVNNSGGCDLAQVGDMRRCIFNVHVPPHGTVLDACPKLDDDLKVVFEMGNPVQMHAGSTAVLDSIKENQPLLGLHGHIHEGRGNIKIGKTVCVNPGSVYPEGILQGVLVKIRGGEIKGVQLTQG